MYFSYKRKKELLASQHKREMEIMLRVDISESDIKELFLFDERQLYSDAVFSFRLLFYIESDEETLFAGQPDEPSFDILDVIEDKRLYDALVSLKPSERQILVLHNVYGIPLTEIAGRLNTPYNTVKDKHSRIMKKVKKFF